MPSYRLRATCPPGTRISSVRHSGDRQKSTTSNSNSSSPSTSSSAHHSQHYQHATNSAHSSASTSRSNSDDFLSRAGASCGVIFEEKQKSSGSHKMEKVRESPPVVGKKIVRWQ